MAARWTPEEELLLGTMSDRDAAQRLGRTEISVRTRRLALRVPKFGARPRKLAGERRRWTPEEDALLGTMPDPDVAARLGRTVDAVGLRRLALEIPAAPTEMWEHTKLSQADVEAIRRLYARRGHGQRGKRPAGSTRVTTAGIAALYGVSQGIVSRIVAAEPQRRDLPRAAARGVYDWGSPASPRTRARRRHRGRSGMRCDHRPGSPAGARDSGASPPQRQSGQQVGYIGCARTCA